MRKMRSATLLAAALMLAAPAGLLGLLGASSRAADKQRSRSTVGSSVTCPASKAASYRAKDSGWNGSRCWSVPLLTLAEADTSTSVIQSAYSPRRERHSVSVRVRNFESGKLKVNDRTCV